ncbi:MAG: UDP-3-O-(3-hydroxymyristoyl)glucosamine N-acyltransferase [Candidatus Pacebacteria bacterium]|nr:UDP-3-O-(3-hydroxymyristoyl)glucosamine N-acyltransferase [Candidatus Paceibacterota bacterium]
MSHELTAEAISKRVGGRIEGVADVTVSGVASLREATPEDVSFLGNEKYEAQVLPSKAGVVLVPETFSSPPPSGRTWIHCADPSAAFSELVEFFAPPPVDCSPGIHPTAVVADSTAIPESVHIGPCAVIEPGVRLGEDTVVAAGCYVGHDTHLGRECKLYPNVTIRERCRLGDRVVVHSGTVIGSDGFGYLPGEEGHTKIPQLGFVQIDSDVEIGAQVAVDRARFGRTWIKRGAKIDNLVQIAHNVIVGENCFLVAQMGIAGSSELGRGVIAAGQVGISGHLKVGDRATLMGQAGISKDVPPDAVYFGTPAMDRKEFARQMLAVRQVPGLRARVKELEQIVERLREKLE